MEYRIDKIFEESYTKKKNNFEKFDKLVNNANQLLSNTYIMDNRIDIDKYLLDNAINVFKKQVNELEVQKTNAEKIYEPLKTTFLKNDSLIIKEKYSQKYE